MKKVNGNHSDGNERLTDESSLGRRSYLKATAGAALLGAAGLASNTAMAQGEDDYDVINVPAGQTHRITLGSGDTLENTLIDITASGALVLETSAGRETVSTGDCEHLRPV